MPKGKSKSIHDGMHSNLHMPKNDKRYKARKLQGVIRSMEALPAYKFSIKDYIMALDRFTELTNEIRNEEKAKRINKEYSPREVYAPTDAGDKPDESTNVGTDVSAKDTDPFAGI